MPHRPIRRTREIPGVSPGDGLGQVG